MCSVAASPLLPVPAGFPAGRGASPRRQARGEAGYNPPHRSTLMSTLMQEHLPRRHRITVEHFYRMAEAGLFAEDERVELIDGEIIDVPPMGHHHAGVVGYLVELLVRSLGPRAIVRPQLPLRLGEHSEPLPDIAVAKPREDHYLRRSSHGGRCHARHRGQQHDASIRSQHQSADVRAARRSGGLGIGRRRAANSPLSIAAGRPIRLDGNGSVGTRYAARRARVRNRSALARRAARRSARAPSVRASECGSG